MVSQFANFVSTQKLPLSNETTLLGVSSGIDSMVMADLFDKAGYRHAIAHCNFGLRGKESDEDEQFVIDYFSRKNIHLFTKKFNTSEFASDSKISIQMAARELRLDWFDELLKENKISYFATAHHLNDQLETFFINLLRGTGIAGLHGILPVNGNTIHPLLFAWREEINDYAKQNNIPFREDSSNQKTDYTRNKIRHELMPLLKKIKPEAEKVLTENIHRIRSAEILVASKIEELKKELITQHGNVFHLSINKVKRLDQKEIILYEIISAYNFNYSDVTDMVNSILSESGKQFFSNTHTITRDRDYFIIEETILKKHPEQVYLIQENASSIETPLKLSAEKLIKNEQYKIKGDPSIAHLDYALLTFPLALRRWRKGDYFYPFGMKGKKLLSDYFIDSKFSIPEKENTWLLLSGDDIVWIIGHRIDDRFKITNRTKTIFRITQ